MLCQLRRAASLDSNVVAAHGAHLKQLITHLVLFSCGCASTKVLNGFVILQDVSQRMLPSWTCFTLQLLGASCDVGCFWHCSASVVHVFSYAS